MHSSIYPLESNRSYTFGELRAAEKMLIAERQADKALSSRLRLQDRKQIDWAKARNEEWSPLKLLADSLGLDDVDKFRWTPTGAADFVIASGQRSLNVQCTMAYDQPAGAQYRGGGISTASNWNTVNRTDSILEAAGFPNPPSATSPTTSSRGEPASFRPSNPN